MKQKIHKIQEVIRVHRNYYVLKKFNSLTVPKIKRIKPVKEIAVPQISLTSANFRTTTSHTDSPDHTLIYLREKYMQRRKILVFEKSKIDFLL